MSTAEIVTAFSEELTCHSWPARIVRLRLWTDAVFYIRDRYKYSQLSHTLRTSGPQSTGHFGQYDGFDAKIGKA